jgi:hypothetical protein
MCSSKLESGVALYAFAVGLANFHTGRDQRMAEIAAIISEKLPLIAWYRSTGNVVLEHSDAEEVRHVLEAQTGTPWAVISDKRLSDALAALSVLPEPPHGPDERPTPGLGFAVTAARAGPVTSTERAILHRLSDAVVAVSKLDQLRGGKLDPTRRRGGWGAVSSELERQVGGRWTSRSRGTLDGLRRRAAVIPPVGDVYEHGG